MRGLSLTQPYASFVASGYKAVETRGWSTDYRGDLAIVATKKPDLAAVDYLRREFPGGLPVPVPLGVAVCVVNLVDVVPMEFKPRSGSLLGGVELVKPAGLSSQEMMLGIYKPKRFAFVLRDVRRLEVPVPVRGALGIFELQVGERLAICGALGHPAGHGCKS